MTERPVLALDDDPEAIEEFVGGLQAAIDASDADTFNRQFARDVLWGSPFGAIVSGYDEIHSIHSRMFAAARDRQDRGEGGGSRYEIEHGRFVAEGVAIAYVRRSSLLERVRSCLGGLTPSTNLPSSCSSAATVPGGWPLGSTRPTDATSIDDAAPVIHRLVHSRRLVPPRQIDPPRVLGHRSMAETVRTDRTWRQARSRRSAQIAGSACVPDRLGVGSVRCPPNDLRSHV